MLRKVNWFNVIFWVIGSLIIFTFLAIFQLGKMHINEAQLYHWKAKSQRAQGERVNKMLAEIERQYNVNKTARN